MNPSSNGWIAKLCSHLIKQKLSSYGNDAYNELRSYGFIYGVNVKLNPSIEAYHRYSEDELTKINLVYALFSVYVAEKEVFDLSEFALSVLEFYKDYQIRHMLSNRSSMSKEATSQILRFKSEKIEYKALPAKSRLAKLEKIIETRVQGNDFNLVKNHLQTVNKALLYIDVLCYEQYNFTKIKFPEFATTLEQASLTIIFHSYKAKETLSAFDQEIKTLLKKARLIDAITQSPSFESLNKEHSIVIHARQYLFDLACRFTLHKHKFDAKSLDFLSELSEKLSISQSDMKEAMSVAIAFSMSYKKHIEQIQNVNLISNIYDGSSQVVSKLIRRNSKRLVREIKQSKDLVYLLTKSTYTDLTKEEQRELQLQLVDILKTIPSLAIFLLPGGAILLPIFARLIPNILPSAFDDNRIDSK